MTALTPALTKRRQRKMAILARREAAYGVDIVPTGAADAIQANDVTLTPLAGTEESRGLMLPYLGNQGIELTGEHVQLEFSVELGGAGAAGTAAPYGILLRACGMAEVLTANTSAVYAFVSDAMEAATIYYVMDKVRHVMLGARGTAVLTYTAQALPRIRFTMWGLVGQITDLEAMPAVVLTRFKKPPIVNSANTVFELHDAARVMQSLTLDLGNQVAPHLMVGAESIEINDRSSSGTAVVEAKALAQGDWFTKARSRERGPLRIQHGKIAGNIVEVQGPAAEIGRPTQGQVNNIATYSLPLGLIPVVGDDELKITVR